MKSIFGLVLHAVAVAVLAACSSLSPFEGALETTPPPVKTGIWGEIEKVRRTDWQFPLNDGQTALDWRLRTIDSATQSIDLQSFLWKFDRVGTAVEDRLLAAADRGVSVRILIDDSFIVGQDRELAKLHLHENVEYRIYNPYNRRTETVASRFLLNLGEFRRLDHRMHNKSMVVDNQVAIVGGRNLADEYFGFDEKANFRDMELLLGGPVVEEISASFDEYWNDRWSFPVDSVARILRFTGKDVTTQDPAFSRRYPIETESSRNRKWLAVVDSAYAGRARLIVDAPPEETPQAVADRPVQVANELQAYFDEAEDEIVIVSAYLIPTPIILESLRDAVKRGVRVRLLTNSINSNNHIAAYSAYRGHVRELLNIGAEVHEVRARAETRPRYIFLPSSSSMLLGLHAKYTVIDGRRVLIGSSNLDPRSLRINTEILVAVESRGLARQILAFTQPDFERVNAWQLSLGQDGAISWLGDGIRVNTEPAEHTFQRIEEWFFAHLPIEDEM